MANDQKRAAALAALMDSSTLTEAAEKAKISRKTLYNYIRNDLEFSTAFRELWEQTTVRAAESLYDQRDKAVTVLSSIMESKIQPPQVRVKAAQAILEASAKQGEFVSTLAGIIYGNLSNKSLFDGFKI